MARRKNPLLPADLSLIVSPMSGFFFIFLMDIPIFPHRPLRAYQRVRALIFKLTKQSNLHRNYYFRIYLYYSCSSISRLNRLKGLTSKQRPLCTGMNEWKRDSPETQTK